MLCNNLFIYLFICGLFNNTVSSSSYISNGIEKVVEGSSHNLVLRYYYRIFWRDRKITEISGQPVSGPRFKPGNSQL
jgi:hypothetical protein